MNDSPITLATIGRLLRRRWRVFVALAVLGGLLGFGSSFVVSPGYASNSKVLLQGAEGKEALASELQVAMSLVVLDRTAAALGGGLTGRDLQGRLTANALDGNVLEIVGTASTPQHAQALADAATREYVNFSSQILDDAASALSDAAQRTRDDIEQRLDAARKRVADVSASPAINAPGPDGDRARTGLQQAQAEAQQVTDELREFDRKRQESDVTDTLMKANLRVIQPPVLPVNPSSPTMIELIAGGALLLPLLIAFWHLVGLRTDQRVRSHAELAAILGAPVLADVTVPAVPFTGRFAGLHDDRRWVTAEPPVLEDVHGRRVRYGRMLARLGIPGWPQQLLALATQDDLTAQRAIVDLAMSTAAHDGTVVVRSADEALTEAVRDAEELAAGRIAAGRITVEQPGGPSSTADLVLTVELLAEVRPAVPDGSQGEPVVLFVTVGTRKPFELNAVAAAGLDAGRPLAGVVVVVPADDPGWDLDFDGSSTPATSTISMGS